MILDSSTGLLDKHQDKLFIGDLSAVGYISTSTHILGILGLTHLLLKSYQNNHKRNITGRLYFDGCDYGLILEGERNQINSLSKTLEKDERHKIRQKYHLEDIEKRHYVDWQMRFDGADVVASMWPGYRHAIKEINSDTADRVCELMARYHV